MNGEELVEWLMGKIGNRCPVCNGYVPDEIKREEGFDCITCGTRLILEDEMPVPLSWSKKVNKMGTVSEL